MQRFGKWLWIAVCFLMFAAVGCDADSIEDGDVDGDDEMTDGDIETVDDDEEIMDGDNETVDGDDEIIESDNETVDGDEEIIDGDDETVDGDHENVDGDDETVDGDDDTEEEVDLCADVDCEAPGICVESISCNPANGLCDIIVYTNANEECDDDDLVCNGNGLCDGAGTCNPQNNAVECTGNLGCVEPDGTCDCVAPYHWEAEECLGPNLLASMEDLDLEEDSFWNGSDGSGEFTSGVIRFRNVYDSEYDSWNEWAYSSMTDTTTPGYANQYSAIAGRGAHDSKTYVVAYDISSFGFGEKPGLMFEDTETGYKVSGMYITNTTYAYLYMLNGDDYNQPFGGENGTDEDWYLLTIRGIYPEVEDKVIPSVEFYLADFRFANSEDDYIISDWTWVDLSSLGDVIGLEFEVSSSDVGDWGMNNPTYFAADGITKQVVKVNFEDVILDGDESYYNGADMTGGFQSGNVWWTNSYTDYGDYVFWNGFACSNTTDITTADYSNEFSAISGSGYGDSANYGVAYVLDTATMEIIDAKEGVQLDGFYVTNTTVSYQYLLNGNQFGDPFGGTTGDEEDWFLLTVTGMDKDGLTTGTIEFYLADYRFADNSQDYIVDDWTFVDLNSLGNVVGLQFTLSSSDTGEYGMNNPAYFAFDELVFAQ